MRRATSMWINILSDTINIPTSGQQETTPTFLVRRLQQPSSVKLTYSSSNTIPNRRNMRRVVIQNEEPSRKYDGYSCCPIFVGDQKLILAEFKYDNVLAETFFSTQEKPRRIFYHLKKDFFPFTYWNLVPRGIWAGKDGLKTW